MTITTSGQVYDATFSRTETVNLCKNKTTTVKKERYRGKNKLYIFINIFYFIPIYEYLKIINMLYHRKVAAFKYEHFTTVTTYVYYCEDIRKGTWDTWSTRENKEI